MQLILEAWPLSWTCCLPHADQAPAGHGPARVVVKAGRVVGPSLMQPRVLQTLHEAQKPFQLP